MISMGDPQVLNNEEKGSEYIDKAGDVEEFQAKDYNTLSSTIAVALFKQVSALMDKMWCAAVCA